MAERGTDASKPGVNASPPRPGVLEGDPVACAEWDRLVGHPGAAESPGPAEGLLTYCESLSMWVEATKRVALEGPEISDGRGGRKPHPCALVAAAERKQIRRHLKTLGLIPTTCGTVTRFEKYLSERLEEYKDVCGPGPDSA